MLTTCEIEKAQREGALIKFFNDNDFRVYDLDEKPDGRITNNYMKGRVYSVTILNGDWKHDHSRLDYIVEHQLAGVWLWNEVTEEDGSDCYSANHIVFISDYTMDSLIEEYYENV